MTSVVGKFAEFIHDIRFEDLPPEVVTKAKTSVLDLIGVAIGGLRMALPPMVISYLESLGGKPEATLIGTAKSVKVPAIHAAMGNGVCAHALDMDDGYRFGGVHTGSTVIPAAIAYGEAMDIDGKLLILATVVGYEIQNRLARAMHPSHLGRGFHPTGTLGPLGAATSVGKICGPDEAQLTGALGLAGLQGAGLVEIVNDGTMAKPIPSGNAAMAGILSVTLAQKGARGPATIMEGEKGVFRAMADAVKTDGLFKDLGARFEISNQYTKRYAACRHGHSALDAVLELKQAHGIAFEDISEVTVRTYPLAVSHVGTPCNPSTPEAGKFSLPFSAALVAYYGDADMNRYCRENLENPAIRRFSSLVKVGPHEKWAECYPDKRGASVDIKTTDGRRFSMDVELAKGEPENPAPMEDLIHKFRANTAALPGDRADRLIEVVMELEGRKVSDVTEYFSF